MRVRAYIEKLFDTYDLLMPKKSIALALTRTRKESPGRRRWTLHAGHMENNASGPVPSEARSIRYTFTSFNSIDAQSGILPNVFSRFFSKSNITESFSEPEEALQIAFQYLEESGISSDTVTRYMNERYSSQIVND